MPSKQKARHKVAEPSIQKEPISTNKHKVKTKTQFQWKCDIRCFKCHGLGYYALECLNRRVMIVKDDGLFESYNMH